MSRGRYAPSPTGDLHLGNARTALAAWCQARSTGSSFVLRVEDLDRPRTVPQAVAGNLDELRWLGLDWDEGPDVGGPCAPYRQSEREEHYRQALERLERAGRVFQCYLSRKELREAASAPHGAAPVYGERERQRNDRVAARKRASGKLPALRLQAPDGRIEFEDGMAGPVGLDARREVGDVVVRRADGIWAYQFAVVVDDLAMGIEEVVRGDDLLHSTAAQLMVYEALGAPPPRYFHLPLLLDVDGERMAKRRGSLTLRSLWELGVAPQRVVGLLAYSLGLNEVREELDTATVLARYRASYLPRIPYRLTAADLEWLGVTG